MANLKKRRKSKVVEAVEVVVNAAAVAATKEVLYVVFTCIPNSASATQSSALVVLTVRHRPYTAMPL